MTRVEYTIVGVVCVIVLVIGRSLTTVIDLMSFLMFVVVKGTSWVTLTVLVKCFTRTSVVVTKTLVSVVFFTYFTDVLSWVDVIVLDFVTVDVFGFALTVTDVTSVLVIKYRFGFVVTDTKIVMLGVTNVVVKVVGLTVVTSIVVKRSLVLVVVIFLIFFT